MSDVDELVERVDRIIFGCGYDHHDPDGHERRLSRARAKDVVRSILLNLKSEIMSRVVELEAIDSLLAELEDKPDTNGR